MFIRSPSHSLDRGLPSPGTPYPTELCRRLCAGNARMAEFLEIAAMHEACSLRDVAHVRAMLARGFPATAATPSGFTALHAACAYKLDDRREAALACARVLLEHGASANQATSGGITPLMGCLDKPMIELLLEYGADVNAADNSGATPLITAAWMCDLEVVQTLCTHGASREQLTTDGMTAAEMARTVLEEDDFEDDDSPVADWLDSTRLWTPLHHLEHLTPERTTALLRTGADIHAGDPSPFDRANQLRSDRHQPVATGPGSPGSPAALVLLEAEGWTEAKRHLMPRAARERAATLAWVGCKCRLPTALWKAFIIPRVLRAEFGHVAFAYRP